MDYQPIENYGVIGDLCTAALVGMDGSIDFMCFPAFDSPTIFAALLDRDKGGRFKISPAAGEFKQRQRYLPDTNILLTSVSGRKWHCRHFRFIAGNPAFGTQPQPYPRRVKVIRGEVKFRVVCAPKFDYGRNPVTQSEKKPVKWSSYRKRKAFPALRLRASVPLSVENGAGVAEFKLRTDEACSFILEQCR